CPLDELGASEGIDVGGGAAGEPLHERRRAGAARGLGGGPGSGVAVALVDAGTVHGYYPRAPRSIFALPARSSRCRRGTAPGVFDGWLEPTTMPVAPAFDKWTVRMQRRADATSQPAAVSR